MSERFGLHPEELGTGAISRFTRRLVELADPDHLDLLVATCGDWTMADLMWHLAEVQLFWSWIIENRPAPVAEAVLPERAAPHELGRQLTTANERMCEALDAAAPDDRAWSWHPDHQSVDFSLRRQTHEALIHCFDGVVAVGGSGPEVSPALAADGFDELVTVIAGGVPDWAAYAPSGDRLDVETTDTGDRWLLEFGSITGRSPRGTDYRDEPTIRMVEPEADSTAKAPPAAHLRGQAFDLDLWAWGRGPAELLVIDGDPAPVQRLRQLVVESTQ